MIECAIVSSCFGFGKKLLPAHVPCLSCRAAAAHRPALRPRIKYYCAASYCSRCPVSTLFANAIAAKHKVTKEGHPSLSK